MIRDSGSILDYLFGFGLPDLVDIDAYVVMPRV